MSYSAGLNSEQKRNLEILIARMEAAGITNKYSQAGIISVISKESELRPQSENLNYSAQRITQVWPKIPMSVAQTLANNPKALGDYVYGPKFNSSLGNKEGEGYKFRGRGFQQITGRANYQNIGNKIGVDLISNPDALNDPKVAADAVIVFFKEAINSLKAQGKLKDYNATNINDFKTEKDSVAAIYHANSGVGKTKQKVQADTTGGLVKSNSRVTDILNYIVSAAKSGATTIQQNPITTVLVTAGLVVFFYSIVKYIKK